MTRTTPTAHRDHRGESPTFHPIVTTAAPAPLVETLVVDLLVDRAQRAPLKQHTAHRQG